MNGEVLPIQEGLEIPLSELTFRFSRSGGPGGQHVNRSETRVELLFDVARSPSLSEGQREALLRNLAPYLDRRGVLHLVSSASRSQHENRREVMDRLARLLRQGLKRRRRRIPTQAHPASVARRLEAKRRRSALKRERARQDWG
ncbi:MAG: alternative ribosome rescue aminoacyl-tRNA hydrolase ArfB [Anaerolineae bacterium]